jgi:peptide/nickel transport system permease protein
VRHILPNLVGTVVVFSTIDMGSTLLAVSSLSFLGFGVPPPAAEWGAMLSEARFQIERAPQLLLYPGMAITVVVLGFNLGGDGLRDVLDPRTAAVGPTRNKRRRRRAAGAARRAPAQEDEPGRRP